MIGIFRKIFCVAASAMFLSCTLSCTADKEFTLPATEDVAMYQINPRVFAPENSFNAISERLDSIGDLGVNVLWFMPIYEIGKENSVNSPYCIRDYKALNPEFGTIDDFKELVRLSHENGMAVIVDWVANHTSWDNAWITEHKDWYTHDESGNIISPANTGWLDVADLDFDNDEMRLAMIDAMKYWVTEVGVDGFRCDAADFVPYDFWKQALDSLRAIPDKDLLMLAEGKRKDHFEAGFDMNYAWDFMTGMRNVFIRDSSALSLYRIDKEEYDSLPGGKVKLRFTTNHDEASKMAPVAEYGNERGSMSAFVIATYLHGGALIYGSQEVGYPHPIDFFKYVPVDWNSNPDLRDEYKRIISIYNEYPAVRAGKMSGYGNDDAMVFVKEDASAKILVAANVRNGNVSVSVPEEWQGHECTDLMRSTAVIPEESLELMPYEYLILKF